MSYMSYFEVISPKDAERAAWNKRVDQHKADKVRNKTLPDGLTAMDGRLWAECRACENRYQWDGDLADGFDQDMSYCGGSPRCCP